ncbi:HTH domain-containing protein [Oxyplasma meridianum]|uniref:HTH domain-containing protein n=1 Tax=Oxyplasma meridianum TaxID=3073602 RepID=A0AAX4NE67_9ARCH
MNNLIKSGNTKSTIILELKKERELSLDDLSKKLGISKVATLKHMAGLEEDGLAKRRYISTQRGRPRCFFSLTENGTDLLPKNYSEIAVEALAYIEKELGRDHVVNLLRMRTGKMIIPYRKCLDGLNPGEKIITLSKMRDEDGYLSNWKKIDNNTYELVEFNCPILGISSRYSEACKAESDMFRSTTDAEIAVTHRVIDGSKACRFLIKF